MAKFGILYDPVRLPVYKTRTNKRGQILSRKRTGMKTLYLELEDFCRVANLDPSDCEVYQMNREYEQVIKPTMEQVKRMFPEEFGGGPHDGYDY